MAEALAAGIAGATLRILGPAGHLVTEERWAEVNGALLAFLAGLGSAPRDELRIEHRRFADGLHTVAICQGATRLKDGDRMLRLRSENGEPVVSRFGTRPPHDEDKISSEGNAGPRRPRRYRPGQLDSG